MPTVSVYIDSQRVDEATVAGLLAGLESILYNVLELPTGRVKIYPHTVAPNAVPLRPISIEAEVSARSNPPEVLKRRCERICAKLADHLPPELVGNGSVSLWLKPVAGEFGTV